MMAIFAFALHQAMYLLDSQGRYFYIAAFGFCLCFNAIPAISWLGVLLFPMAIIFHFLEGRK